VPPSDLNSQRGSLVLDRFSLKPAPQNIVEAAANRGWHWEEFSVAVELDGFDGRVKYHLTMPAPANVFMKCVLQFFGKLPVQIFRDFLKGFFTGQDCSRS
jgi:hypothetical protein